MQARVNEDVVITTADGTQSPPSRLTVALPLSGIINQF